MALRDRIAAEIRDLDQKAGRAVSNVKDAATSKANRRRFDRQQKAEQQKSLRQRVSSDLGSLRDTEPGNSVGEKLKRDVRRGVAAYSGSQDVEPGTEAGDKLHKRRQMSTAGRMTQAAKRAAAATQSAADGRIPQAQGDSQAERAWQAAHVSPPTDHQLAPVDDRGMGTFQDFVTGTRRAEGMDRFQQTVNRSNAMQWTGQHSDGSATVVTAQKSGGQWVIAASEQNPAGRSNGQMQIGTARSKDSARERALDWIEKNPEGMPLHQQAGQRGAAGYATGESMVDDGLVFNTGSGLVDNDIVFGTGDVTDGVDGGGLVGNDDLDLVFGGDDWQ